MTTILPARASTDLLASVSPGPDLAGIALRATILGATLGSSLFFAWHASGHPQLPLYIAALSLFHLLEFWTTAKFNPRAATTSSFLLSSNGVPYWAAQAAGVIEYLVVQTYFSRLHGGLVARCAFWIGLASMSFGQIVRTLAMAHAGQSFSHTIAYEKRDEHVLVVDGIYSISRHPSYLGFFYFGIGTQIMLLNPVSCVIFAHVLWKFFDERIR